MRILLLGNAEREGVQEEAERLVPFLRSCCEIVVVDLLQEKESLPDGDLALVLGGDGAILRAVRQMGYQQVPVLGINLGRLGFLADLDTNEFRECFPGIIRGEYEVTDHLMFECVVRHHSGEGESQTLLGLNEVVVHTMPPFHILDVELRVEGDAVSKFSGDGLIVSTPVGSTAHNLSAGGPILSQELPVFVLTPICPHALTYRPVVDSADKEYRIRLVRGTEGGCVIVDGQEVVGLSCEQEVVIRKAPVSFRRVKVAGRSFFQTLRDKLRWGTPPNYRSEP